MNVEEYEKIPEAVNHNQLSEYGSTPYNRTNYMTDQHGGTANVDLPPNSVPNSMYSAYNQNNMRPGFTPNSKGMNMNPVRPPSNSQSVSVSENYSSSPRYMMSSGSNVGQQSGPTPTLNQLLQSPNPVHRYQTNYNDYSGSAVSKSNAEMNSGNQYAQQWGGPRGMQAGSPYSQQMNSSYRNPSPNYDPSGIKGQQQVSSWSNSGSFSQQQQMSPGGTTGHYIPGGGGANSGSYPPRYPSPQPQQVVQPPRSNSRGGYPSQQVASQYNQQHSPNMFNQQQGSMTPASGYNVSYGQTSQPSYQNSRVASPHRQQSPVPPPNNISSSKTSLNNSVSSVPGSTSASSSAMSPTMSSVHGSNNEPSDLSVPPLDDLSGDNQQTGVTSAGRASSPATSGQQLATVALSPNQQQSSSGCSTPVSSAATSSSLNRAAVPSPGTPTSRSMSPAVGNQNIPSSPRPSSVHSDTGSTGGSIGSHHNPSPMPVSQQTGFNNQQQQHVGMPNGPNSMGPPMYNSGNKMHPQHQANMMGVSMPPQAGGCPPGPGYVQGPYPNRGNSSAGNMGSGYGVPHHSNAYGNASAQYGGIGNYGPRMTNHINQPGGYGGGYGNQIAPGPGGQFPPGTYQQGGAQAAAQAAVIAAASSATPNSPSRTPHYLKQHLQQKMSGAPYGQQQNSPNQSPYSGVPPQASSPHAPNSIPPSSTPLPPNNRVMSNSMPGSAPPNSISNSLSPSSGQNSSSVPGGPPMSGMPMEGYGGPRDGPYPVTTSSGTSLTQSVNTPNTNSSMPNSEMSVGLTPPIIHDEASQHSTASTSSSQHDQDHMENDYSNKIRNYKETISHPPTPASTLPSPGAASMSSYHDEFENASSPGWPRTPASPVFNNQPYEPHHPKRPDGLLKLYELSDEPDRRIFLDKLIRFNEEKGSPMTNGPTLSKQPLDLYRLYVCVKERAGFLEVTKSRLWKEISIAMNIGSAASTAYALRKQYIKHLLPFECKFDRGGIDPVPLVAQLENSSRKKKNAAQSQGLNNSQGNFHNNQNVDGYPGCYLGQYPGPGGPISGQPINSEYPPGNQNCPPGMIQNQVNSDSISIQDPFSDDMQYQRNAFPQSQYPGGNNNGPQRPMGPQYQQGNYGSNSVPEQFGGGGADPQQQYRRGSGGGVIQPDGNINQCPPNRNVPPSQRYDNFQGNQFENRDRFDQSQSSTMPPPPPSGQSPQFQQQPPHQRFAGPTAPPSTGQQDVPPFNNSNSTDPRQPFTCQYNSHPNSGQTDNQTSGFQGSSLDNSRFNQGYQNQQGVYNQSAPQSSSNKSSATNCGPLQKRDQYPSTTTSSTTVSTSLSSSPSPSFPLTPGSDNNTTTATATNTNSSSKLFATITGNRNGNGSPYPPSYPPPNQYRSDHPPGANPPTDGNTQGWRDGQFNHYNSNVHPPGHQPASGNEWNSSRTNSTWSRYGNQPMQNGPVPYPNNNNCSSSNNNSHSMQQMNASAVPPPNASPFQQRYNQSKMSPYKPDVRFMHSQKMPPPHISSQYNNKKEIIFPPDSIEAVPPLMIRRKIMSQRDIGSVEAWRILMSLKSGLLAESTWALDVLSVLLYDDSTVVYFSLRHLPGLLEVLLEHFRRALSKVFEITDDLENGCYDMNGSKRRKLVLSDEGRLEGERQIFERGPNHEDDYANCDYGIVGNIPVDDKTKLMNTEDYSLKARNGKPVKLQASSDPFVYDSVIEWDRLDSGFDCGLDHWTAGCGDTTMHIQSQFCCQTSKDRFVCHLKDVNKDGESSEECDDVNRTCSDGKNCHNDNNISKEAVKKFVESNMNLINHKLDLKLPKLNAKVEENFSKPSECKVEETCGDETVQYPRFRDRLPKRTKMSDFEDEAYHRDEPSLLVLEDSQDDLSRRCICLSSLIRNLSFVPGNDSELSKHPGLLLILGRLLLLHHNHLTRRPPQRNYDKDEDADFTDSCSSLHAEKEWWWDMLHVLRENTLVTLSNIAAQLDLSVYPEDISLPLLDGLLHWSVCPSSYARDALPTMPPHSVLSPQRLSLETLCKISVLECNVDLLLATPPHSRIESLYGVLAKSLSRSEDQVVREFAVTLLSYFAPADSSTSRLIALQGPCISHLINFVEQAEQNAMQVANSHGINMLRENPEMMGTSLDMMRRAASTLLCLARVSSNRALFMQHQSRLLTLVMSQILDQHVAGIISDILYECSLVIEDECDKS